MDVVKELCDIERALREITGKKAPELAALADRLNRVCVDASLTVEAFDPVLETDAARGRGGDLTLMDLCYNAFMIGRRQENREDGDRTSWFQDCQPLMLAGVDRIRKDVVSRVEYARTNTRRQIERSIENVASGLTPEQAEAGAACLYGHLDSSFSGGDRVSYPQASEHTKGKYRRAFASAVVESGRIKTAA